jgi:Oxaloacetate decarboxylase, gamma chain.
MNNLMIMLSAVREPIATHDWVVTVGGFCIVITALVVLFLIFTGFSKLVNHDFKKNKKTKTTTTKPSTSTAAGVEGRTTTSQWSSDWRLALSKNVHDEESGFVTIQRVERRYSPWSSKIYGLNGLNRRNY